VIALGGASMDRRGARLLRRVPAGVKLIGLALVSVGLFFLTEPALLAVAAGLAVALAWCVGGAALFRALRPVGLMLVFAFVAHGALGDWMLGLTVISRITAILMLATAISASTGISEMLAVLDRLTAPLRLVGVSTRPISIACLLTLRFAPLLGARWQALAEAWRARSPRAPRWRLVTPFTISALDDADRTAEALAARGAFAGDD